MRAKKSSYEASFSNKTKICDFSIFAMSRRATFFNMSQMIISPGVFFFLFCFFNILIFWVVMGVTGQKTVQNDEKFCPSCSVSQEPYIIWLSFMVHIYKMISSDTFFIFSKFLFSGSIGGKRAKKIQICFWFFNFCNVTEG